MTWIEAEQGWVAAPEEIVNALSSDGFAECKREVTTSRQAMVFITVDGESLNGDTSSPLP